MSDILHHILSKIRANIVLFIVLIALAVGGAIIHFNFQKVVYVSNFDTTLGELEYELFQDFVDFENISERSYDIEAKELSSIKEYLSDFTVSYVMRTTESARYALASKKTEFKSHEKAMKYCLKLLNSNLHIKRSFKEINRWNKLRVKYLDKKMIELDSMMNIKNENMFLSNIPGKMYELYSIKISLLDQIKESGNIKLLRPVVSVDENKRPLIMFVFFYLVIAIFIFFIAGKKASVNQEHLGSEGS